MENTFTIFQIDNAFRLLKALGEVEGEVNNKVWEEQALQRFLQFLTKKLNDSNETNKVALLKMIDATTAKLLNIIKAKHSISPP